VQIFVMLNSFQFLETVALGQGLRLALSCVIVFWDAKARV
jgi:hypothetical protein